MMRIGEVAKQSGLSVETLRYYETQGLLSPAGRSASGYRFFDEQALQALAFIKHAKSVGFSLKEVGELLTLKVEAQQHSCAEVKALAEKKLVTIENKLTELQRMKQALTQITNACEGGAEPATSCTILSALSENSAN